MSFDLFLSIETTVYLAHDDRKGAHECKEIRWGDNKCQNLRNSRGHFFMATPVYEVFVRQLKALILHRDIAKHMYPVTGQGGVARCATSGS